MDKPFVVKNAGATYDNTVTAKATDDEGTETTATASATVHYVDVLPSIVVTKTPDPTFVYEGTAGQTITFTFTITNTSLASTDPVTLTSVSDTDNQLGDLLADAIAANGGSAELMPGASLTFTKTVPVPVQNAGI